MPNTSWRGECNRLLLLLLLFLLLLLLLLFLFLFLLLMIVVMYNVVFVVVVFVMTLFLSIYLSIYLSLSLFLSLSLLLCMSCNHNHSGRRLLDCEKSLTLMRPRSQKSTDGRRWLWQCVAPLKTVAMSKKWHLRARLHLFFAAMCRKWYLASLLLGENGAWSRPGRVDMDADEALQMFFDEDDANVPNARFSDSDLPESDDGDNVELTDDWAG